MNPIRVFLSSAQREFAVERAALRDYLRGDALMRRFFEPFLFEVVPARPTSGRPTPSRSRLPAQFHDNRRTAHHHRVGENVGKSVGRNVGEIIGRNPPLIRQNPE